MTPHPAHMLRCAADHLERAAAVHLSAFHTAPFGVNVHAEFVVSHDRHSTGTITDLDGSGETDDVIGRADYLATPFMAVVRGDDGWWAMRTPARADRHVNTWLRTEHGVAYPVTVVDAFNPGTLSDLLRELARGATAIPVATDTGSERAVTAESGGWLITTTATPPHAVVRMAGPVRFRVPAKQSAAPLHMAIVVESTDSDMDAVRTTVTNALAATTTQPTAAR